MKQRLVGYIVECKNYRGMYLAPDGELYFGKSVTVFYSRYRAKKAIEKTKKERLKVFGTDFELEFGKLRIVQTTAPDIS